MRYLYLVRLYQYATYGWTIGVFDSIESARSTVESYIHANGLDEGFMSEEWIEIETFPADTSRLSKNEIIAKHHVTARYDRHGWHQMTDLPEPSSPTEALAQALTLAIVAPTDEKAQQAVALADRLAAGLPETEVARAKKLAQGMAKEWEDEQ